MICISVTPTSRQLAKVDLFNASRHCDLVELCVDHLAKEPDFPEMLEGISKPVLISCRRQQDGGKWQGSEEDRQAMLRKAIIAGPAYVELELDIAGQIPRFGETKRVISYTSLHRPLGRVDDIFEEAAQANADVVKFTWPTPTLDAAWPLLAAVSSKRELPVVGKGLGRAGRTFSLLGQKYGSPWIYAALEPGMETHPGEATVWELNDVYDTSAIGPATRLIGIVGFGSAQETTVRVLNAGFRQLNMDMRCLPLAIGKQDRLGKMLEILKINALCVSPLFAQDMLSFADHAEDAASQSEYADLLLRQKDGWHAFNAIWRIGLKHLEATVGRQSSEERPLDRRNVMLLGAGGQAPALAWGIRRRRGVLSVSDPDDDAARELAQRLDCRFVPFASLYETLADVAVIADPHIVVGHRRSEMNPSWFRPGMTVLDVCGMPEETAMMREAQDRGCKVVSSRDLYRDLVGAQFQSLSGSPLPDEAIDSVLQETSA